MAEEKASAYPLGSTDAEHERLIRQAARLAPVTERFFREAGIASGQRVLDIGCGVGDVAMLASRIVGATGSVVAIERDSRTLDRARVRANETGLHNIEFVQTDIDDYSTGASFDALVGRYILQFLPEPTATLRALTRSVRSGGIVAFQEGSWAPFVALSKRLPLWSAAVSLLHDHAIRAGADVEMGPNLHRVFQDAGLPAPHMRLEMELGYEPEFTRWVSDSIRSILPQVKQFGLSFDALGDLETLQERLHEEVARSRSVVPWLGLAAAWCRKP